MVYGLVQFSLLYLIVVQMSLMPQRGPVFSKFCYPVFTAADPTPVTVMTYSRLAYAVFLNRLKEVWSLLVIKGLLRVFNEFQTISAQLFWKLVFSGS
jgi:hypothetical protein